MAGGIRPLTFRTALFRPRDGKQLTDQEREASELAMLYAVWFLAKLDQIHRKTDPQLPKVYDSGIRYHHRWDWENWPDWRQALEDEEMCCKGMTAERLAELWGEGIDARPFLSRSLVPDGPYKGMMMYHYRIWRPLKSLLIDPPPFFETPWGPTVIMSEPGDHGEQGVLECPSIVLGLYWEGAFATTNRRPASAAFIARLTQILGHKPMSVADAFAPKIRAAAGAGTFSRSQMDGAIDDFLGQAGSVKIPTGWTTGIRARNPTALALWQRLRERAKDDPRAAMALEAIPMLAAAANQRMT